MVFGLFTVLSFSHSARAQHAVNLPDYDEKPWHYGFILGAHYSYFRVTHDMSFVNNVDSTVNIQPRPSPGFAIQLITDLPLGVEFWNLRFTPGVAFYENTVDFEYRDGEKQSEVIEAAFAHFPVLVKHKSLRRGNMRMYVVGGFDLSFKIGGTKQKLDPERLATEDMNLEITYGFGSDMYLEFFKFAPEIRFSHGIANMLYRNGSSFGASIDRMTTHRISFILNFE